ncbi:chromosome partitioning protein, ParB family [Pseudonocardia ammonioxydans]|uniref:Chromosome partitioning protein, ParB family n=1 Tax=Pseudonocardia ammonioxydans TaxID=260086 RepID=A0A1I5GUI9_PSUAM|nr:ParB/RepB/Spo0J family partition protein [Pseudonocardia ammonioxydans]SFO39553.1 chromosome partitioning protein, ParB family [Pseudonocardia ammonioxydans]
MTADPTPTTDTAVLDAAAFGRLALVDPDTLELEVNTRLEANLDPHFCASIRDHGVREPITVRRRASDGTLVVRKGQRRTLAAVRAGLTQVPVIISPEPATEDGDEADTDTDDYRAGQAARIVEQLVENQHRRSISASEEVAAHQQLLGFGLKASEIAKATRTKADRVRQTTQAAQSKRAVAIGSSYDLDLVQMSVIAEFEDDDDAVELLTRAAVDEPAQFRHVAQRLRDQRAEQQVYAAAAAELAAAGVLLVIDRDDDRYDAATELYRLRPTAEDPEDTALEEEAHRSCPGHAAQVRIIRPYGQPPEARYRWLCLDPAAHGHAPLCESMRTHTGAAATALSGESDEDRAAREAREKEAARLERRRVIANNKEWDSAQSVRRDWLAELLAKKAAPKGAAIYVAAELGQGAHALRRAMETGNALACELLGLEVPAGWGYYNGQPNPLAEAARAASGARATMLSLAMVLAAYEDGTHRGNWRSADRATQQYLAQLRAWGYPLSEVEQLALDPDAEPTSTDHDTGDADTDGADAAGPDEAGEVTDPELGSDPGDDTAETAADADEEPDSCSVAATPDEQTD